ncbi:Glycosyltransferase sugar-binding region containing DXD motif-containing protein [Pseudobutyrivibrio sp. OR37]|uniref:glycosyltransferase family 32 protein n=1 Tax=Pseudobutyrivibrio sp. OR37 TaxID=1798186 RepID=UPI0008EFA854|nr:glycosyltransferase [Pseudobutyrivibrio sp. OR37]SFI08450.1 Glycosyltransferase sugar-binding region containing DXD motif-containing protein [Pseudobutyrivibrio sp. OR37]
MFIVESIGSLSDKVEKGYSIICYGAGKMCLKLATILESKLVLSAIKYIIDSSPDKQGQKINVNNQEIKVISIEEAQQIVKKDKFVLLINNLRYEEILPVIKETPLLNELDVYSLALLQAIKQEEIDYCKNIPLEIKKSTDMLIPKRIHYCWFGKNQKSQLNRMCIDSWKKYCSDYEIIEWNETNYDIEKNSYMRQAYKRKKWGFVSDYARLDVIYHYGGIYLDTDVEIIQSLDELLYQDAFCAFEHEEYVALGLGFGACKGNRVVKDWLDDYEDRKFIKEDGSNDLTPCPIYQTAVLKEYGLVTNGEYQILDGITVFPGIMINGMCSKTRRVRNRSFTKAIHHYEASWQDSSFKEHNERVSKDMER